MFTAGTTGVPKGVLITHRAFCAGYRGQLVATRLDSKLRVLQFTAYAFDLSLGEILHTLLTVGCICVPAEEDTKDADAIAGFMRGQGINVAWFTPSLVDSLLDAERSPPSLEVLILAGEPMLGSQRDAWAHRVTLVNLYGPTEAVVSCTSQTPVTRRTLGLVIGRPHRGAVWIVDANNPDHLLPVGAEAELLIEGPILASGYLTKIEHHLESCLGKSSCRARIVVQLLT
ncbi:hypothetical protein F4778DRAFT_466715 [Xylariomycetidae sp. FL2044]|nr:hypothetical protein F4778DRAFT_466715 [Xylariomycetidae sp. FL2044]